LINPQEYAVFRQLEATFAARIAEIKAFRAQVFTLPDGQRIMVHGYSTPVEPYRYHVSPFGVVRTLTRGKFDKTGVCLELDEVLIAELAHAAGL
jgi:hypothetical protein